MRVDRINIANKGITNNPPVQQPAKPGINHPSGVDTVSFTGGAACKMIKTTGVKTGVKIGAAVLAAALYGVLAEMFDTKTNPEFMSKVQHKMPMGQEGPEYLQFRPENWLKGRFNDMVEVTNHGGMSLAELRARFGFYPWTLHENNSFKNMPRAWSYSSHNSIESYMEAIVNANTWTSMRIPISHIDIADKNNWRQALGRIPVKTPRVPVLHEMLPQEFRNLETQIDYLANLVKNGYKIDVKKGWLRDYLVVQSPDDARTIDARTIKNIFELPDGVLLMNNPGLRSNCPFGDGKNLPRVKHVEGGIENPEVLDGCHKNYAEWHNFDDHSLKKVIYIPLDVIKIIFPDKTPQSLTLDEGHMLVGLVQQRVGAEIAMGAIKASQTNIATSKSP